jgi:hypothetical protein
LEIRYKFKDNKISLIPLDTNSVHLIRLIGIKKIPKYNLELEIQNRPLILYSVFFILH